MALDNRFDWIQEPSVCMENGETTFTMTYRILSPGDGNWDRVFTKGDLVKFVQASADRKDGDWFSVQYDPRGEHDDPKFGSMLLENLQGDEVGVVIAAFPTFVDASHNRLIRVLMGTTDCFVFADQIERVNE